MVVAGGCQGTLLYFRAVRSTALAAPGAMVRIGSGWTNVVNRSFLDGTDGAELQPGLQSQIRRRGQVGQDRWLLVLGWADVPHRPAVCPVAWLQQPGRPAPPQAIRRNGPVCAGKAADLLMMVRLLFSSWNCRRARRQVRRTSCAISGR